MLLRVVQPDDYIFLFDLLKEKTPEQNISHKEMPTWEQHCAFNDARPYKEDYIIEVDGHDAGRVYLTKQNEVGIHIAHQFRGQKLASRAIKQLIEWHKGETLYANVAPRNQASMSLFTSLGFTLIQHTYRLTGS